MDTRVLSREKRARKSAASVHAFLKASQSICRIVEDEGNWRDCRASTVPKYYILTKSKTVRKGPPGATSAHSPRFNPHAAEKRSVHKTTIVIFDFCSYRHHSDFGESRFETRESFFRRKTTIEWKRNDAQLRGELRSGAIFIGIIRSGGRPSDQRASRGGPGSSKRATRRTLTASTR